VSSLSVDSDRPGRICSLTVAYGELIVLVEEVTDVMDGPLDSDG